jgi:hypothetical protein
LKYLGFFAKASQETKKIYRYFTWRSPVKSQAFILENSLKNNLNKIVTCPLTLTRLWIVMHLKNLKYARKYSLKNIKICIKTLKTT